MIDISSLVILAVNARRFVFYNEKTLKYEWRLCFSRYGLIKYLKCNQRR